MLTYKQAIELITNKEKFHIKLGLERISEALNFFNNPQDSLKCIHIAGTNGKGSVCAILDSILREAGYKIGLYTSPHIWNYTERIKVNGIEISKEKFSELTEKVCNCGVYLTEFETLTVIMFLYFKEKNIDIAILETGLGGRLDATNVIEQNICAIITHIDLDHTDVLGNTKDKIAFEKAGIIKKECPIITSMGYEAIKDKADTMDSMFILVQPQVEKKYIDALALKGKHQTENLALALAAIEYLYPNINDNTIINGLKNVVHHCRFEYNKNKNMVIDASHNPNSIQALRDNLDTYFPNEKRRFIFGCLNTKDYQQMMNILFRETDEIYLYGFNYPKACTYEELKKFCPYQAKQYHKNIVIDKDKLNIVCGSFYMLNELKYLIEND